MARKPKAKTEKETSTEVAEADSVASAVAESDPVKTSEVKGWDVIDDMEVADNVRVYTLTKGDNVLTIVVGRAKSHVAAISAIIK